MHTKDRVNLQIMNRVAEPQFYTQLFYKAPVYLTLRIKVCVVAFFEPKKFQNFEHLKFFLEDI